MTEVLNEVLVGRLDAIYNEREKMFQQGNYEEVQFRDYEIFKNRYYSEIKEKFFEEVNNNVKNTIEDSFSNIELYKQLRLLLFLRRFLSVMKFNGPY